MITYDTILNGKQDQFKIFTK